MWRVAQTLIVLAFALGGFTLFEEMPPNERRIVIAVATAVGFGVAFLATYVLSALIDRITAYRARQLAPEPTVEPGQQELAKRLARLG